MQCENDQLWAQVEKSRDLGKDVRDGDRDEYPIARNKGKESIVSKNDSLEDDELSSMRSLSTSPLPGRNAQSSTRAKSRRKHSHRPALNDAVSGASRQARE